MKYCLLLLSLALTAVSARAAAFTYDDLVSTIKAKNVRSLEELLPLLPAEMRSHYVLMHTSESLQDASFESPRIAMFGLDASLTCAFNGDSKQAGFDSLECFQWKRQERAFDFRQIVFPSERNHLSEVAFSARNHSADGKVACATCHGADPRPNWNDYSFWPNTYGEGDESNDSAQFKQFTDSEPKHPRYKHLLPNGGGAHTDNFELEGRTNLVFSDFLGRMNAFRVTRLMEAKLTRSQLLGNAMSGLKCELNDEQKKALAGTTYQHDMDEEEAFKATGVPLHDWTTRPLGFDKPHNSSYSYWEHQSGFSLQTILLGMVQVTELAEAGNEALRAALQRIMDEVTAERGAEEGPVFLRQNRILVDPDHFGSFTKNTGYLCPELTKAFIASYPIPTR